MRGKPFCDRPTLQQKLALKSKDKLVQRSNSAKAFGRYSDSLKAVYDKVRMKMEAAFKSFVS
jgi:hypothetical protein